MDRDGRRMLLRGDLRDYSLTKTMFSIILKFSGLNGSHESDDRALTPDRGGLCAELDAEASRSIVC
jgi:hypothetical protein